MRLLFIVIVLVMGNQAKAQERRWQCIGKDDKELIRLDKTIPCPIGFRAEEIDTEGKVITNGFDPLANTISTRCVGISKVIVYGERECLTQKALGWMKGEPVQVNREGFTTEEAKIDVKRRENLEKQKAWEKGNNYLPIIDFNTKNLRQIILKNKAGFDPVKDKADEECRSWKNSYVLEPTPEKQKFIRENCS